jgi:hypothetical protein
MQSILYAELPWLHALVHFHYSPGIIVFPEVKTTFPYPCGVVEEAYEVLAALPHLKYCQDHPESPSIAVELCHHGYLLMLDASSASRLTVDMKRARLLFPELAAEPPLVDGVKDAAVHNTATVDRHQLGSSSGGSDLQSSSNSSASLLSWLGIPSITEETVLAPSVSHTGTTKRNDSSLPPMFPVFLGTTIVGATVVHSDGHRATRILEEWQDRMRPLLANLEQSEDATVRTSRHLSHNNLTVNGRGIDGTDDADPSVTAVPERKSVQPSASFYPVENIGCQCCWCKECA